MTDAPQDAALLDLRASGGHLSMLLNVHDEPVSVELEIQPATEHALRHIHDLHAPVDGGDVHLDVHVDLLLRCLGSLGVLALALVVRAESPPAFYLRLLRPCAGEIHLDLNVLDAACLLLSRRLAVQVERRATRNWDVALRRLLDQGQQSQE